MKTTSRHRSILAALLFGATAAVGAPSSDSGLDYYAQGGVVVDGVAYFASDDHSRRKGVVKGDDFPNVVAFDVATYRRKATYPLARMYDSAPLVVKNGAGRWLVIGHEHEKKRTAAVDRDNGQVVWDSEANQPGLYFFGYSYWHQPDGSSLILAAAPNGLHALSSEDGRDAWHLPARSAGGITPCVDQAAGVIYYQSTGTVWKVRAADGKVLRKVSVPAPVTCISWNTLLVDDTHGKFVATRWYGKPEWDSAIRVYDSELNLVWERTGLASGKKDTLVYAEGKLLTGVGNGWSKAYTGTDWKKLHAYRIADGSVAWTCDLAGKELNCIPNVLYFGGSFYAESQGSPPIPSKLFRISAATGELQETLDYGRATTSCAPPLIGHGKLFSGDLWQDRTVVVELAKGSTADWRGPFGDPQRNDCAVRETARATPVPLREVR